MASFVVSPAGWKQDLANLLPLAIVSFALGMTTLLIVVHHPVAPLDLPALTTDQAALDRVAAADRAAADKLRATPPTAELRAIGTALYAWNEAAVQATSPTPGPKVKSDQDFLRDDLRAAIATGVRSFGAEGHMDSAVVKAAFQAALHELRSLHTEMYLAEVRARSITHAAPSAGQRRLEGVLGRVLERNGWVGADGALRVPMSVLRVRYKLHWTSTVFALADCEGGNPIECYGYTSLPIDDEEVRAMLAFLFANPIVRAVDAADAGVPARALDRRRREYLSRLTAIDSYVSSQHKGPPGAPGTSPILRDYPIGVANAILAYRAGAYEASRLSFQAFATHDPHDGKTPSWWSEDSRYFNWWHAAAEHAP
ncbi:MAG: hypothetical protein ACHREM_26015 [Polyangiales bacterium]